MPFVRLSIGRKLSQNEKTAVYDVVTQHITTIPGKSVDNTMVQIAEDREMFMDTARRVCIFGEIRLFGKAEDTVKARLVELLSADLAEMLEVEPRYIYLNIMEFEHWGSGGKWK